MQIDFYHQISSNKGEDVSKQKIFTFKENINNILIPPPSLKDTVDFKTNTRISDKTSDLSSSIPERLEKLRNLMQQEGIDAYIIRSTNKYNMEEVPLAENSRYFMSNFTGYLGDMIVTQDKAYLIVNSMFEIQAPQEVDTKYITLIKQPLDKNQESIIQETLISLGKGKSKFTVGIDGEKNLTGQVTDLEKALKTNGLNLNVLEKDLVETIKPPHAIQQRSILKKIPKRIAGFSPKEKLALLREFLAKSGVDALLISDIESLTYLSNLKGNDLPYYSSFKGVGLITKEGFFIFTDNNPSKIKSYSQEFRFFKEKDLKTVLSRLINQGQNIKNIGIISGNINFNMKNLIEQSGGKVVELSKDPIIEMKAIKNESEIRHMKKSFRKLDKAFAKTIEWLNMAVNKNQLITEADVAQKLAEEFNKWGATGLSFKTIAAAGKNSAIIDYTQYETMKPLVKGDLLLLDGGAFYKGGYVTDLTRTVLIGGNKAIAQPWQKKVYTTCLKASLQALYNPHTPLTSAYDLDGFVRYHTEEFDGFKFSHRTGHGVGRTLHEYPSISNVESAKNVLLKNGMVFSIEPGLYKENQGGVRIENIVTIAQDQLSKTGLKLKQLTYAPLDNNTKLHSIHY